MVSKEDWAAAMSSEVFREYMARELRRQAEYVPETTPEIDEDQLYKDLAQLEAHINSNPMLRQAFSSLRQKFVDDPDYAAQVDPSFVRGVFMLDLDQE